MLRHLVGGIASDCIMVVAAYRTCQAPRTRRLCPNHAHRALVIQASAPYV